MPGPRREQAHDLERLAPAAHLEPPLACPVAEAPRESVGVAGLELLRGKEHGATRVDRELDRFFRLLTVAVPCLQRHVHCDRIGVGDPETADNLRVARRVEERHHVASLHVLVLARELVTCS